MFIHIGSNLDSDVLLIVGRRTTIRHSTTLTIYCKSGMSYMTKLSLMNDEDWSVSVICVLYPALVECTVYSTGAPLKTYKTNKIHLSCV